MTEANEKVKSAEYTSTPDPPVRSSSDLLECLKYHEDAAAECAQDIIDMGVQDDADDDIGLGGALRHNEFMHNRYAAAIRVAEAKLKEKELTSICVYCGAKLISKSIDTKMNDVIEHMAECEKHPVPILLDKLANIEQWFLDHKEHSLEIHNGWARLSNEGMFDLGNNEHFNKKITELEAQVEKMKKAIAIRDRIME